MHFTGNLVIKSLHDGWHDKDIVMLHACFQLFINCIEEENLLSGHINWLHDEEHINAKQEIEALYKWWKFRKELDANEKINGLNENQYLIDNEMLIRLISIRKYLWT
ncbi:MAG: hypothetical protein ACOVLC_13230 [Flavobacterium sp.]